MNDVEKALVAWACQEIRELDELGRSMIPGYEPLEPQDMENLTSLEDLAAGSNPDDVVSKKRYDNVVGSLQRENEELSTALEEISYIASLLT